MEKRVSANNELPASNIATANFVFMILPPAPTEGIPEAKTESDVNVGLSVFSRGRQWPITTAVDDPGQLREANAVECDDAWRPKWAGTFESLRPGSLSFGPASQISG